MERCTWERPYSVRIQHHNTQCGYIHEVFWEQSVYAALNREIQTCKSVISQNLIPLGAGVFVDIDERDDFIGVYVKENLESIF